ncbi:hypothetical protein FB45DRAFT_932859 [Roridomyces roridus]|uniref:MYND-type domain-containing protein n=1 Tax=Roridomyces roridus TaxID=1738132 RepID=A0AAD7BDM6_9AGAR|nr:hypothetical protein FB45DRAFT_932859 [Roridomyces roridus]
MNMSAPVQAICICGKPAPNRCSGCKSVSYCSQECQKRDWKTHKIQCRTSTASPTPTPSTSTSPSGATLRRGSTRELQEILRVGAQSSIYQDSSDWGLEPFLISGANGEDYYRMQDADGSKNFWGMSSTARDRWDAKAQVHNRKSKRFWMSYLSPISVSRDWIDAVLDAVLHVRLPTIEGRDMWQDQVNANALAGLFPHLEHFTHAQNTALLDVFGSRAWYDESMGGFRLGTGTTVLFAHGQPTMDLVEQLLARCLNPQRPGDELEALFREVALPMHKFWSEIVETRVLDLVIALLAPGWQGGKLPADKILEIAECTPESCKYLLPFIEQMCRARLIESPVLQLLTHYEHFGVDLFDSSVVAWLLVELVGDDQNTKRRQNYLKQGKDGKLKKTFGYGIKARDYAVEEMEKLRKEAVGRLGNPTPI